MTCKAIHLVAALLLFSAMPCNAEEKFMVFDYQDLVRKAKTWPQEARDHLASFQENQGNLKGVRYLVMQRDAPQSQTRDWAVITTQCEDRDRNHFELISVTNPQRISFLQMLAQGRISNASDVVVLDNDDLTNLIRITWLNRESIASSSGTEVSKKFNLEFLQSVSRGWFISSAGEAEEEPLLIILDLTTSSTAQVYVCLRDHSGPTPFFEVTGGHRATLANAISLLKEDRIPAELELTLNLRGFEKPTSDLRRFLDTIDINFVLEGGRRIPAASEGYDVKNPIVRWNVSTSKEILAAKAIEFRNSGANWQFIDNNQLTGSIIKNLPKPDEVLRKGSAAFDLFIAQQGEARGFRGLGIWRSTVQVNDIDLSPLIEEYRARFSDDMSRMIGLFDAPKDFVNRNPTDGRRRQRRGQESQLVENVLATRDLREAVWRHILIGLAEAKDGALILLVKNPGGPFTSIQTRDNIERGFSLLRSFVESKLANAEKKIPVLVSEKRAIDFSQAGMIEIFVLPSAQTSEDLEDPDERSQDYPSAQGDDSKEGS